MVNYPKKSVDLQETAYLVLRLQPPAKTDAMLYVPCDWKGNKVADNEDGINVGLGVVSITWESSL